MPYRMLGKTMRNISLWRLVLLTLVASDEWGRTIRRVQ